MDELGRWAALGLLPDGSALDMVSELKFETRSTRCGACSTRPLRNLSLNNSRHPLGHPPLMMHDEQPPHALTLLDNPLMQDTFLSDSSANSRRPPDSGCHVVSEREQRVTPCLLGFLARPSVI